MNCLVPPLLCIIKIANTNAAFEPKLDYVIAKLPRFPFDKFTAASNLLGTQMKATGEVMGIGSNLEEALLKGIRSLEIGANHIYHAKFDNMSNDQLLDYIQQFRDDNIFAIAELLSRGVTVEQVHDITKITPFFLEAILKIVDMEENLKKHVNDLEVLRSAKQMGFSDKYVARMWECTEMEVFKFRKEHNLFPVFKMVCSVSYVRINFSPGNIPLFSYAFIFLTIFLAYPGSSTLPLCSQYISSPVF